MPGRTVYCLTADPIERILNGSSEPDDVVGKYDRVDFAAKVDDACLQAVTSLVRTHTVKARPVAKRV